MTLVTLKQLIALQVGSSLREVQVFEASSVGMGRGDRTFPVAAVRYSYQAKMVRQAILADQRPLHVTINESIIAATQEL